MNETPVCYSKFNDELWAQGAAIGVGVTFLSGLLVYGSFISCLHDGLNWAAFIATSVLSVAFCVFLAIKAIGTFIEVTVAPEALFIKHLITRKEISIAYNDIKTVSVVTGNARTTRARDIGSEYRRLEITLKNDDIVSFTDIQFLNYDELKEAIRRNRFHLDQVF